MCITFATKLKVVFCNLIGLSWGSEDNGGVCQARRYFIRIYENFSVQKLKSYNSGIVTYKFYGELVKPKIGEIAFLRQVGTAFGAPVSLLLSSRKTFHLGAYTPMSSEIILNALLTWFYSIE